MSYSDFQAALPTLQTHLGLPIAFVSECDSTNRLVAEKSKTGWRGVLVTDFQTAGRGRLSRGWTSERGANLLFSWVFDVTCEISEVPRIPLLMAGAIADELDVFVKWPNDIWDADGYKLGGILSSIEHSNGLTHTVVIGVGLNVHQMAFPDMVKARSLSQVNSDVVDRAMILSRVLAAMQSVQVTDRFDVWRKRSFTLGKWVSINHRQGIATGIREDGALIVDGIPVTTGDVHLVESNHVTRY